LARTGLDLSIPLGPGRPIFVNEAGRTGLNVSMPLGLDGSRLSNALGYKLVWTCKPPLRRGGMVLPIPLGPSRHGFVKTLVDVQVWT